MIKRFRSELMALLAIIGVVFSFGVAGAAPAHASTTTCIQLMAYVGQGNGCYSSGQHTLTVKNNNSPTPPGYETLSVSVGACGLASGSYGSLTITPSGAYVLWGPNWHYMTNGPSLGGCGVFNVNLNQACGVYGNNCYIYVHS